MKIFKDAFLTTCCSFTLVVIFNCLFETLFVEDLIISVSDVYMVLLTCICVSFGVYITSHFENIMMTYIVMILIVFLMEYLFYDRFAFTFVNILVTLLMLTIVFFIVYFVIYYVNDKDAKKINSMIQHKK